MRSLIAGLLVFVLALGCATTPMQKWATAQSTASTSLEAVTIYSRAGYLDADDAEQIDIAVDALDIALRRAKEYAKNGEIDLMDAALEVAYKMLDRLALYLAEQ